VPTLLASARLLLPCATRVTGGKCIAMHACPKRKERRTEKALDLFLISARTH
jgi:hypothetical protein